MVRYNTFTKTITLAAVLLLVSQFCVYASNDYLSEKETEGPMASGITMTTTVDYVGNYVYENGTLARILFDGGYVDMTGTAPKYMFYLTDHIGNVRVVADSEGNVEQVNHYYPYGDRFDDSRYALASSSPLSLTSNSTDRLFGGKELDSSSGLYDFEARYDNTMFGRFTTIDPMAEKYYGISPYSYCSGNPINRTDSKGRDWYSINRDGMVTFLEERQDENYDRLFIDGNDDTNATLVLYDMNILLSMMNGFIPGESRRKDALSVFYFAADSFINQEWGLYYDGKRYALRTDKSIDSVTSPFYHLKEDEYGPQVEATIWKIHSHSDTPDNERLEIESMGYWGYNNNMYDNKGNLIDRNAAWHEATSYYNDVSNYKRDGITSYVYFPISKSQYRLTDNVLPKRIRIK